MSAMCSLQYLMARSRAVNPSSYVIRVYIFEVSETVNLAQVPSDLFIADHCGYVHEASSFFAAKLSEVEVARFGHRQELDGFFSFEVVEQFGLFTGSLQFALKYQVGPIC